ncbi:MAG: GHKL domain-containing protein [Methylobacillus sp.]|jgi:signal transduction histidine kinase|nr:GHKL domain-containing protein [Methylobacillus sp.]
MKSGTRTIAIAIFAATLIVILGVLVMKTRAFDINAQNEINNTLRDLRQLDSEWDVDVLRAKIGLSSNYDRVASPLARITTLKDSLAAQSAALWGDYSDSYARLTSLTTAYSKLMDDKISLIEQFKSQNAILRNSSHYLPVAASELAVTVRSEDILLRNSNRAEFESALNNLLTDLAEFEGVTGVADATLRDRITTHSADLVRSMEPFSQEAHMQATTLLTHMQTLLKQQDIGEQLLTDLGKVDTLGAINALGNAYNQEQAGILTEQQFWLRALIIYSVILLLLLTYAGWRIVRSIRLLNQSNTALGKAYRDLQESQVQLIQSEKMSGLGRMVAGVAHEINTPLAYVSGTLSVLQDQLAPLGKLTTLVHDFIGLLRSKPQDKTAVNKTLLEIEADATAVTEQGVLTEIDTLLKDGMHGIDQISEIVLNLKNFSRVDRVQVSNFSVEAGLDSTLVLANNVLKTHDVAIHKNYGGAPTINGSPSQINQVFLNLITNAAQAMPADREEQNVITLSTSMEDHDTVRIEIEDNGAGIPKDVLPNVFDPFFTTKPIGEGTGMGLSICFQIIEAHGGRIQVDSEQDVGTIFTILLPIKAAQPTQAAVVSDD